MRNRRAKEHKKKGKNGKSGTAADRHTKEVILVKELMIAVIVCSSSAACSPHVSPSLLISASFCLSARLLTPLRSAAATKPLLQTSKRERLQSALRSWLLRSPSLSPTASLSPPLSAPLLVYFCQTPARVWHFALLTRNVKSAPAMSCRQHINGRSGSSPSPFVRRCKRATSPWQGVKLLSVCKHPAKFFFFWFLFSPSVLQIKLE